MKGIESNIDRNILYFKLSIIDWTVGLFVWFYLFFVSIEKCAQLKMKQFFWINISYRVLY